ncbi:hypothetical protein Tco_1330187 [Tanacetum coccineum]
MQGQTAKELWESLERKYKTEDAGTKKFVVARFLDYKMVDSKNVISQVQDLQGKYGSENVDMIAMVSDVPNLLKGRPILELRLRMERLNLGNSPTANIKGKGDVIHIWKRV